MHCGVRVSRVSFVCQVVSAYRIVAKNCLQLNVTLRVLALSLGTLKSGTCEEEGSALTHTHTLVPTQQCVCVCVCVGQVH